MVAVDIVGRDEERALLTAALDGGTAAVCLDGEAGIGKSTLWRYGVEHARARGVRVLESRPAEAERGLAYVGLVDLLEDAADAVLPRLAPPRRRALEVALFRAEGKTTIDTGTLGVAVRDALDELAREGPLLVAIDDVQWFDDPSSRALALALRRAEGVSVLLARRVERGRGETEIEHAVSPVRIAVGPLSIGAGHRLLQDRLQRTFPRPVVLRLHETAGGNPFYMLELARTGESSQASTLDRLGGGRLVGLPDGTRDAVLVVAAHGRPSIDILDRPALEPAVQASVVEIADGIVRFTHPLLAEAVYERASQAERRAAHRLVAGTVDDPVARARHLALAAERPGEEIAATLEDAARIAASRGATLVAAGLAELSVRLTPEESDAARRRRVILHGDLLADSGDGRRAIGILKDAAATAPAGLERARAVAHLARAEKDFVGSREGVVRYLEALPEAEGDDALVAEIHLRLADLMKDTEDANLGLEHARLAIEAAARTGDTALRCDTLAMYAVLHARTGLGPAEQELNEALALERSLEGKRRHAATDALVYQLLFSGDSARTRAAIEQWRAKLALTDDREDEFALWYLAMNEWRAGDYELAARYAAASLAVREQFGIEGSQPIAELPAAMADAYRGEVEAARARSLRALARAEADGIRISESGHRAVLGFIELSLGDPEAALRYLRPGWAIRDGAVLMEPGHRFELADTLEALIAVGALDEAEEKLRVWEERSARLDRPWARAICARCRALLHAAGGDFEVARQSFDEALRQHARTGDPFQHARTLLALGATQRRAMQRGAARETLAQAAEIFERIGSPLWAANARAEVKRIGGRAPGTDELTESERRVADLVAAGKTNHEVAAALFLGERTVASHLTHIYAKLGVRSRTELARRLR